MRYPGGKNFIYKTLINLIPEHDVYIEPFLGSGAVLRNKRPAKRNIGIDIDQSVIAKAHAWGRSATELHACDGIQFLSSFPFQGAEFIYCDPPYVHSTRRSNKIYQHEMTDDDHFRLTNVLAGINCKVMISGYQNDIYSSVLTGWNVIMLEVPSQTGMRKECLWLNYEPPEIPFDLRFIGRNFREREQVKRRHNRLLAKIAAMPTAERALFFGAIERQYQNDFGRSAAR